MKNNVIAGALLMAIGFGALAYQGISYTTQKEVLDVGPLKVQVDEKKTIPLPPILGGMAIAGGVALILFGWKRG